MFYISNPPMNLKRSSNVQYADIPKKFYIWKKYWVDLKVSTDKLKLDLWQIFLPTLLSLFIKKVAKIS